MVDVAHPLFDAHALAFRFRGWPGAPRPTPAVLPTGSLAGLVLAVLHLA